MHLQNNIIRSYTKSTQNWFRNLNVKTKNIELLEGNTRINLHEFGLGIFPKDDTKNRSNQKKKK